MTKVLFTYDYGNEKMDQVRALGYDVLIAKENGIQYLERFEDVEVLVCYKPFETLDIRKMNHLKWIQLSSIGIDQTPLEYVEKEKIQLTNNKGGYSVPMGEWIVLKVLESYKDSKSMIQKQEKKEWHMNTSILELVGKTIGFIGTGTIAHEAAKRLQGFEMKVLGVNTNGRDIPLFDQCYAIDDMQTFLKRSDIVVCTIPYTAKTHHLINRDCMNAMKKESVLINVARGSIIDEQALIEALENGHFRSVALDVFEQEPLPVESPLWSFERAYISAHNSWISEMRNERRFDLTIENLRRYINNETLLNQVNISKGY